MIDLFKKTVLAGIGATVVTAEFIEKRLSEFVEKGKITRQEAAEMASKIAEEGKKEFEQARAELGDTLDEWMKKARLARQSDVEALAARVAALEQKAHQHESPSTPTAS